MKKLARRKAVQMCREIRVMFVQMYRKLQEIDGKTHENVLYLINNAREVHYFCVKMIKNNEKNEQNMCRIYIKCVESMYIIYKNSVKSTQKER